MSDKLELVTVPRDLYYHEVAYVRGLEADNERLRAALHNLQGCDIDNAAQDIIIRALEPKP